MIVITTLCVRIEVRKSNNLPLSWFAMSPDVPWCPTLPHAAGDCLALRGGLVLSSYEEPSRTFLFFFENGVDRRNFFLLVLWWFLLFLTSYEIRLEGPLCCGVVEWSLTWFFTIDCILFYIIRVLQNGTFSLFCDSLSSWCSSPHATHFPLRGKV